MLIQSRNICIFSDGTGQGGESVNAKTKSNVRIFFEACSSNAALIPVSEQICFYDPGLGSDPDSAEITPWRDIAYKYLSLATGYGITKNIIDCYAALIAHWQPGDRIFLFGFSRGAYTVRSLGGVIKLCGVPKKAQKGDAHADRLANRLIAEEAVKSVYMAVYDSKGTEQSNAIASKKRLEEATIFRGTYECEDVAPYFIGIWDTVRALGFPVFDSATQFISDRIEYFARHKFHDDILDTNVPFARHALSIDENRAVFKPELWNPSAVGASQDVKQRWFAGVHSDVGGGYDDCRKLADITLDWMVKEASSLPAPLLIDPKNPHISNARNSSTGAVPGVEIGKQHDERVEGLVPWTFGTREKDISNYPDVDFHLQVKARLGKNVEILKDYNRIMKKRIYKTEIYNPDLGTHPRNFSS